MLDDALQFLKNDIDAIMTMNKEKMSVEKCEEFENYH